MAARDCRPTAIAAGVGRHSHADDRCPGVPWRQGIAALRPTMVGAAGVGRHSHADDRCPGVPWRQGIAALRPPWWEQVGIPVPDGRRRSVRLGASVVFLGQARLHVVGRLFVLAGRRPRTRCRRRRSTSAGPRILPSLPAAPWRGSRSSRCRAVRPGDPAAPAREFPADIAETAIRRLHADVHERLQHHRASALRAASSVAFFGRRARTRSRSNPPRGACRRRRSRARPGSGSQPPRLPPTPAHALLHRAS
jgi:hypothetical protein